MTWAAHLRAAWRIAAALVGLAAAVALATRGLAAARVREALGFTFAGLERRPSEALAVFANNARLMAVVLVFAITAQLAAAPPGARRTHPDRQVRRIGDLALTAASAAHAVLVGGAVGGYGRQALELIAVHGPLELMAFCLALSLYVAGRRGRLRARTGAQVGATAVLVLALSALLEVYA